MAPVTPAVTLTIGNRIYGGWKEVEITRGLEEASGSFRIQVSDRGDGQAQPWAIEPGDACTVMADGDRVIAGHVDIVAPTLDGHAHGLAVSGRSRTGDLVDCSVIKLGGQWVNATIADIARELAAPFGIYVESLAEGKPVPHVQVQQGETVFALLERLARLDGLLLTDDEAGRLVIRRAGAGRAAGALVEGENIRAIAPTFSMAARHSKVVVKAQSTGFDDSFGDAVAGVMAEVRDPGVTRYRPLLVVAEAAADASAARQRARWEVRRRAGRGTMAEVTVVGWRQPDGRLWRVGERVPVRSPTLHLDREMEIGKTTYRLGDGGTTTVLSLALPGAFDPEPVKATAAGGGSALWRDVEAVDGEMR